MNDSECMERGGKVRIADSDVALAPRGAPAATDTVPSEATALSSLRSASAPQKTPRPHAPLHQLTQSGTYFVTVGTYHKAQHFRGADRLGVLCRGRLTVAHDVDWQLEAWAVFSQHYHFVAHAPTNADKAQIRSEWLNAWMSTEVAKAFFDSRAKRSTNLASISATNIEELPNPLPPADEQRAIVVETAKLDARRAATERTIVLLKERRAALIAAAVTGRMTMHESTEENAPGAEECQDN